MRDERGILSGMTAGPADAAEVIRLWPDGPPTRIEGVPEEAEYLVQTGVAGGTTFLRNISDPTLTVFAPAGGTENGVGVIVVPGGGWTINAWTHEGVDVARWLTRLGYAAFVLKYRVQASDPDQAVFESTMAAVDARLAAPLPAAEKPLQISDLISTERYLRARAACTDDGCAAGARRDRRRDWRGAGSAPCGGADRRAARPVVAG